jgi:hypothetical protein
MIRQGRFIPKNPHKYRGNFDNIIFRSSWERRVMVYLDDHPSIVEWSSEEIIIPYVSPIDNRYHRYYVDFFLKIKTKDGQTKTMLWEIKPAAQTQQPEKKKRVTRQYITEVMRWGVNEAKWRAATEYCLDKGWEFRLITEKDLGITYK